MLLQKSFNIRNWHDVAFTRTLCLETHIMLPLPNIRCSILHYVASFRTLCSELLHHVSNIRTICCQSYILSFIGLHFFVVPLLPCVAPCCPCVGPCCPIPCCPISRVSPWVSNESLRLLILDFPHDLLTSQGYREWEKRPRKARCRLTGKTSREAAKRVIPPPDSSHTAINESDCKLSQHQWNDDWYRKGWALSVTELQLSKLIETRVIVISQCLNWVSWHIVWLFGLLNVSNM